MRSKEEINRGRMYRQRMRQSVWLKYRKKDGKGVFFVDCVACNKPLLRKAFTIDHVFPKALGGTDHLSNLQPMCGSCNEAKGSFPLLKRRSGPRNKR